MEGRWLTVRHQYKSCRRRCILPAIEKCADENYQRLKKAKIVAEEALQNVISQESWKQYLALDEICNELECARYKAMYLAGASDYEKLSK